MSLTALDRRSAGTLALALACRLLLRPAMRLITIGVLLLAQLALACGDGGGDDEEGQGAAILPEQVTADLAATLCEAVGPCECQAGPDEASACVSAISPAVARRVVTGETLGLRYHAECLARTTAYLDALACRTAAEVEGDATLARLRWDAQRCKLLAGGDLLGDPCASAGNVNFMSLGDSCAQGLYCAERCYELIAAAGEACAYGECPPGTDCLDPDADGVSTCEKPPASGERCNPHGSGCEGDLVCDPTELVCGDPPGPGEACPQGQCASDSLCVNSVCEELAGDGEPCSSYGCAAGLRCDYDTGLCGPPVDEGEPCFYAEDCAEGLLCDSATYTCTPLPGEGDDCPSGLCAAGLQCGFDYTCAARPPVTCELPFCVYRLDGLCDEPGGTGLCQAGTDPEDCEAASPPSRLTPVAG